MSSFVYSLIARLGEYDVNSKEDCVQGVCADPIVRIKVAEIIVHPNYSNREHDIAILRLEEEAPYTGMYSYSIPIYNYFNFSSFVIIADVSGVSCVHCGFCDK